MSNDENSKESEESTNKVSEAIDEAAETVTEAVDSASDAAGNIVSKILALKESNPKVFFGGIAGLVLVVIILMFGGESKAPLTVSKFVNITIGQSYELKGVNTYDPNATVQVLPVPGSIAAYDEDPKDATGSVCKYMPQGTKVKAIQLQEAFGNVKFVQIEMLNGECAGKKGWVISNNLN